MTQMQETELQKALDRLAKADLKAVPGVDRRTGKSVYGVLNRTATEAAGYPVYHMVYRNADGKFTCDCKYGQQDGKVCVHKAAAFVHERDAGKASALKAAARMRDEGKAIPAAARAALEEIERAALPVAQAPQGVRTLR